MNQRLLTVAIGFAVSVFPVAGNLETGENQQTLGIYFDIHDFADVH